MANGSGPLPERPQDYAIISGGTCITTGEHAGCIKVGDEYYWLSRKASSPFYWVHSREALEDTIVYMTSDVWDKCKEGGTYTYSSEVQGWVDGNELAWRWDGQAKNPIFLSYDFK